MLNFFNITFKHKHMAYKEKEKLNWKEEKQKT